MKRLLFGLEAGRTDSDTDAVIGAYVEEQMRRLQIPDLALAIVEGDTIVYRSWPARIVNVVS